MQNLIAYLMKEGKEEAKQYLKFGRLIDKEIFNEYEEERRRSNEYSYDSVEFGNIEEIASNESEIYVREH